MLAHKVISVILDSKTLASSVWLAIVTEWLVKEGDNISQGQRIAEIEQTKAAFCLEASVDGVLRKILIKEDEAWADYQPLGVITRGEVSDRLVNTVADVAQREFESKDPPEIYDGDRPETLIPTQVATITLLVGTEFESFPPGEGIVTEWYAKEGDSLEQGQQFAEVEFWKALVDVVFEGTKGVLRKTLVKLDDAWKSHQPFAVITNGEVSDEMVAAVVQVAQQEFETISSKK